ncbi:HEAT repeat domain-containing protein [Microbacterium sp. LWH11-1.2]|uniref:HEAT repeat domain-containing protein n=1 Tax=Microbacterium sp. LWH11-1.2 TaxID=3135258 RepID=UPI0031388274
MSMLIGEVAQQTGISARMLRHYDRIGLVSPTERTAAGYRRYSDADVQRLFRVEGLRSLGLGLAEIPAALTDEHFTTRGMIDRLLERSRDRLARAQELVSRLEQVHASEPEAWPDVMRTIGLMRGFEAQDASTRQRHALSLPDGDGRDVGVLVEAVLREQDPNAAGAMAWAVARAGDTAIPLLTVALDSPDDDRRHRALRALEKIGSPAALQVLTGLAEHHDPLLRARAHLARGRSGDAESIDAIVELIVLGTGDIEALEVLEGLAASDDLAPRIAHALAAAAASDDPAVRRRLAGALGSLPGDGAFTALRELAEDLEPSVALTARALLHAAPSQRATRAGRPAPG